MLVGPYIRELRKAAGLSQAQLGSLIGSQQSEVARWESGGVVPSGSTLLAIQRTLGDLFSANPLLRREPSMGALERYLAVIDHVRDRPISVADRDELGIAKRDLEQLRERINEIIGRYDLSTLIDPIDTSLLKDVASRFAWSITLPPPVTCFLGISDDNGLVDIALDRTRHGIVVIGHGEHADALQGSLYTSAAGRLGPRNEDLEIWTAGLPGPHAPKVGHHAPLKLIVECPAEQLGARTATTIRQAIDDRERQLSSAGKRTFVKYWSWQLRYPGAWRMRRVLFQIRNYELLCNNREFNNTLAELLAKSRSLGVHVQLIASEIPEGARLDDRIQNYLDYRATLVSDSPTTLKELFPAPIAEQVAPLIDQQDGVGVVFTPPVEDALTRFRCATLF